MAISFVSVALLDRLASPVYWLFEQSSERSLLLIFFTISTLFGLSFLVFYISHLIKLPAFVIAIFFGILAKPLLAPILHNHEILNVLVGLGATLILFAGGLETPFANFRKLIAKIFSISFLGLFVTAFLFSVAVYYVGWWVNSPISIVAAVLLGAVLASTDPAAIIPVLKRLRFYNRSTKDIVISESAVTDVVGTLLTIVFLGLLAMGANFAKISDWYLAVFNVQSAVILGKQLFFGTAMGLLGYFGLEVLAKIKYRFGREFEADSAFFIFIPVAIFTFSLAFGGSGYLAAFVAGLLFQLTEYLSETERFFNSLVDGFFKPIIFILLGALVVPASLLSYAPIGILAAVIFMFVIRPIAVFVSLGLFARFGRERLGVRDLLFIAFIRETGAIPAVLLVTIVSLKLTNMQGLVEVGMWVILLTLIIEPLLTTRVAQWLGVAEVINDAEKLKFNGTPKTVLLTRGKTFVERLPAAVAWSRKRNISKVMILLCLENKYTPELEKELIAKAQKEFDKFNQAFEKKSESLMQFKFVSRKGTLEDNIRDISEQDNPVTVMFVGKKMLDYRLNEIKDLRVPIMFID